MPLRVMVVERYLFVRDVLRRAIHPRLGLEVVAEAGGREEAIGLAMEEEPDVILLDVDWPSLDGLTTALLLRHVVPETVIVMYSSDPEFETADPEFEAAHAAIAAGADAYLPAASTFEEMLGLLQRLPAAANRRTHSASEPLAG